MPREWPNWPKADERALSRYVLEEEATHLVEISTSDRSQLLQTPRGRKEIVRAIYEALKNNKEIDYAFERYQPDEAMQPIRTPTEILDSPREGTCLDLAILFCGLCFGYGLLPMLIILEGHALAAVSLSHQRREWDSFAKERSLLMKQDLFKGTEDLALLRQWIDQESYVAVECTGFAHALSFASSQEPEARERNSLGYLYFDDAVRAGKEQLHSPTRAFKYAIDIAVAQYYWHLLPYGLSDLSKSQGELVPSKQGQAITINNTIKFKIADLLLKLYQKLDEQRDMKKITDRLKQIKDVMKEFDPILTILDEAKEIHDQFQSLSGQIPNESDIEKLRNSNDLDEIVTKLKSIIDYVKQIERRQLTYSLLPQPSWEKRTTFSKSTRNAIDKIPDEVIELSEQLLSFNHWHKELQQFLDENKYADKDGTRTALTSLLSIVNNTLVPADKVIKYVAAILVDFNVKLRDSL